ncbi:MAG: cytochrome c-type biogenesis protein CcmH [Caldilineaceae bacterium]|nr:cytochrome c-type biogenesis protein CcmH [Caldilineaceae bacterium]
MVKIDSTRSPLTWALWLTGLLALVGISFWFISATASAQGISPTVGETDVTADEVNQVARELWCPLCSGVRLDGCELKACDQMKEIIAIKLSEGEDTASIKSYFVDQYGPQVLGAPPLEGFNWLAWILPFAVMIGGGVFLWLRSKHWMRPAAALPVESTPRAVAEKSEYERKLDEELKRYG